MKAKNLQEKEEKRLEALYSYQILDTEEEPCYNGIVELASQLSGKPIAIISFKDKKRQWLKAKIGGDIQKIPIESSLDAYVIHHGKPLVVHDATQDPGFSNDILVKEKLHIKFYAGIPLINEGGFTLGTLSVMDHKAGQLSNDQIKSLSMLGKQVMNLLKLRLKHIELNQDIQEKTAEVSDTLERITDTFLAIDKNWRFTYLNKQAGKLLHRPPKSLIGKKVWEEFPEAIGSASYKGYMEAMNKQKYTTLIDYYPPLDIWVEYHMYPSKNGISVFVKDITERKKAELEINRIEDKRFQIMDAALDAIICMNIHGTITFWNTQAEKMFGWKESEIIGKQLADTIIPDQYRKHHHKGLKNYLKTNEGPILEKIIEITALDREGKEFPIELIVTPIKQANDQFFCAFIREISERKKVERQLIENKESLERAEEQAYLGSWYLEMDTGKRHWSKQLLRMFGYDPNMKTIPPFEALIERIHPDDRHLIEEGVSTMYNGKEPERKIIRTNPDILPLRYFLSNTVCMQDTGSKPLLFEGTLLDITERKKNEESLRVAEEKYRNIFENALDGIFQSTPDGKIITANAAMANILGYVSAGELINAIQDIGTQLYADPQARVQMKNLLLKHGRVDDIEIRTIKNNKEEIWLRGNIRGVFNDTGEIEYLEGAVKNVTEQKTAEERIVKEKELANSIINSLPGVFYLYNTDGKFIRWNTNFETVTGYSADEITNLHPSELFEEGEERDRVVSRISEVFEKGYAEVEANFLLKDLRKIPYYFNGWKIEYQDETCLIGVGIDISDRKIAENKLRNSENKLRAFFRSTPDSSVLLGKNFEILDFNAAADSLAVDISGKQLKEGNIFTNLDFPEAHSTISGYLTKALKGETIHREFHVTNVHTGDRIWWSTAFMPAYDNNGNIFGTIVNSTNIDEIKQTEFRLKKQFEELQKTNQELDHFVYKVSHDLRAPLATILGIINVAELGNPPSAFQKYLIMIRNSINRLDGFIRDILNYSQNARKAFQVNEINFQELINASIEKHKMMSGADRLNLTIDLDTAVPYFSDKARMEIIFSNLMSNAIKYQNTNKEFSNLSIQVSTSAKSSIIKFADNGIGIESEHLTRIFDMFYRASENSIGAGLGLYIVKETLNKLDGKIEVKSKFKKYTTFTLEIPNQKLSSASQ